MKRILILAASAAALMLADIATTTAPAYACGGWGPFATPCRRVVHRPTYRRPRYKPAPPRPTYRPSPAAGLYNRGNGVIASGGGNLIGQAGGNFRRR